MIGQSLSHFRITAKLGEGGMGVVYRAEDTRLGRPVAIKLLPPALTADPERLERLEREARILASLNHPRIATLHQYERFGGRHFLVMELVEGETLAERLARGPLPVEEASAVGLEIVRALEAAHGRSVVHRDLKPANIKLTPDGGVKVLDFGIAKAVAAAPAGGDLTAAPTLTAGLSQVGEIIGTAAYMSPEQARGEEVDGRTDVWAFGCVLYEMLTGRAAFGGDTAADCISRTLSADPDWEALPASTPPSVRRLLRRCLAKDAGQRLHAAADARLELEDRSEEPAAPGAGAAPRRPVWVRLLPWALLPLAVAGGWVIRPRQAAETAAAVRFEVSVPAGERLTHGFRPGVALSPDGQILAFVAGTDWRGSDSRIYLRNLARWESRPLAGTKGASHPVFSPDGRWLAFMDPKLGLRKIPVAGGPAETVCDCDASFGIAWGAGDRLVFAGFQGALRQVPAAGGEAASLTELDMADGETSHRLPHFLPGGETVLFTAVREPRDWGRAGIATVSIDGGERHWLLDGGADARYVPPGYLVYAREGKLMAVRFDPERLAVAGVAAPVLEGVNHAVHVGNLFMETGAANLALGGSGTLAYLAGSVFPEQLRRPVLVDRQGRAEALEVEAREYLAARMSRDGRRLLLSTHYTGMDDIWILELERGSLTRQTFDGGYRWAAWGPGPEEFTVGRMADGRWSVRTRRIGSAPEQQRELLSRDSRGMGGHVGAWSPDGESLIVVVDGGQESGWDLWVLDSDGRLEPLVASELPEAWPDLSPDGRWVAYSRIDETGRADIFVQPYPGPGPAVQVSTGGEAFQPTWSRDGSELIYRTGDTFYSVAIVAAGERLQAARPRRLFEDDFFSSGPVRSYDSTPDGRLVVIRKPDAEAFAATIDAFFPDRILVVRNWAEEMAAKLR